MADSRSNYSLTTFNSSGELVQIKHALAAVQSGATSLGIRAVNGVVLATEKKLPSTLVGEDRSESPPFRQPSDTPCAVVAGTGRTPFPHQMSVGSLGTV